VAFGDVDGDDPFGDLPFRQIRHAINKLTPLERGEVEAYVVGGFEQVNAALRGFRPMTESLSASIDTLRSAIRKFELDRDARVTREISATDIGLSAATEAPSAVGRAFTELGFLSTSMNENPPHSSIRPEPIDLDLRIPAGTHALAIGSLATFPLEHELLVIDSSTIFVVHSRYNGVTCRWRLYCRVLSEGELP
jgi:hypothetical protein